MHVSIRPFGNSRGIVIPKPLLTQLGLVDQADLTVEDGALVIRKPAGPVRAGWADAAKAQANMGSAGHLLENVKTRVDSGVSTIANLIAPLTTLQSEAKRAADGLRELAHATGEQLQASEQIARNADRIAASASAR